MARGRFAGHHQVDTGWVGLRFAQIEFKVYATVAVRRHQKAVGHNGLESQHPHHAFGQRGLVDLQVEHAPRKAPPQNGDKETYNDIVR